MKNETPGASTAQELDTHLFRQALAKPGHPAAQPRQSLCGKFRLQFGIVANMVRSTRMGHHATAEVKNEACSG